MLEFVLTNNGYDLIELLDDLRAELSELKWIKRLREQ